MAERQTLYGKAQILSDASTMDTYVLKDHLDELASYYLPEAVNDERKQYVLDLMARISFELTMRELEASKPSVASSVS